MPGNPHSLERRMRPAWQSAKLLARQSRKMQGNLHSHERRMRPAWQSAKLLARPRWFLHLAKSLPQRKRGAGIHAVFGSDGRTLWMPAFAGMTGNRVRERVSPPKIDFPPKLAPCCGEKSLAIRRLVCYNLQHSEHTLRSARLEENPIAHTQTTHSFCIPKLARCSTDRVACYEVAFPLWRPMTPGIC
jgi:hypothetical protein